MASSSPTDLENTDRKHNVFLSASERAAKVLSLSDNVRVYACVCIQIVLKDHRTLITGGLWEVRASLRPRGRGFTLAGLHLMFE